MRRKGGRGRKGRKVSVREGSGLSEQLLFLHFLTTEPTSWRNPTTLFYSCQSHRIYSLNLWKLKVDHIQFRISLFVFLFLFYFLFISSMSKKDKRQKGRETALQSPDPLIHPQPQPALTHGLTHACRTQGGLQTWTQNHPGGSAHRAQHFTDDPLSGSLK